MSFITFFCLFISCNLNSDFFYSFTFLSKEKKYFFLILFFFICFSRFLSMSLLHFHSLPRFLIPLFFRSLSHSFSLFFTRFLLLSCFLRILSHFVSPIHSYFFYIFSHSVTCSPILLSFAFLYVLPYFRGYFLSSNSFIYYIMFFYRILMDFNAFSLLFQVIIIY